MAFLSGEGWVQVDTQWIYIPICPYVSNVIMVSTGVIMVSLVSLNGGVSPWGERHILSERG